MKKLIIAIALLSGCVHGKRKWSNADFGLELGFGIALGLDAEQTYWNLNKYGPMNQCGESNPILGPCGDRVPLVAFVPIALAAHIAAAHYLPGKWRNIFQAVTLGVEASTVYGNAVLGSYR